MCIISPGSTAVLVNFRATAQSSSSISVQWDRLTPCRDVNGLIVEFRVQYRALPSGPVQTLQHSVQSEMWNMPVEVSLTGLSPFTNYSIQAAPVNILSQVGSYSDIAVTLTEDSETTIIIVITWNKIIISTSFSPAPGPVDVTLFPSFFKIIVTWGHPTMPNGIITGYEVIYWPAASPETATTVNTGLETTYTLSGLDVGMEFSFIVRAFTQLGPGQPVTVTESTLSRPCKDNKLYMLSVNKYLSFNYDLPFTNSCSRGCDGY